jgi:hypothetical protein
MLCDRFQLILMYFGAASHIGNGCGLGVSSCAKEVHGGRVWVQCCDDCRRLTVGVWGCSAGLWVLKVPLLLGRAFLRRCGSLVLGLMLVIATS